MHRMKPSLTVAPTNDTIAITIVTLAAVNPVNTFYLP